MPDISMCYGLNCKRREYCYRFTATPSHFQSYFAAPPDPCEYFWSNGREGEDHTGEAQDKPEGEG